MSTSCLPFSGRDFADMKMVVCAGRFIIPDHVSTGLQTLLRRLIILNPSQRASLNLFMDDPWLNAEGDARAELRKIYDFELLVGPTDHQVMPELDDAIVQIMIRKYKFEEQEILASFAANNFDEITTVYRLLWSEKQRKPPVPARSLAPPQPTPPVRVRPSIASKRSVSSATLFDKKDDNSSSTQQIQPLSPVRRHND
jgi:MAP/microtubule affinity-regulating kinase